MKKIFKSLEIERKFLIKDAPENMDTLTQWEIIQGYICSEKEREIRLRKEEGKYYLTIKCGRGETRSENEIELSRKQFNSIWPTIIGNKIEKTRYEIPYDNRTIQLDIFKGYLHGLVLAEVEFNSEEDSANFLPPEWFGDDVTQDEGYKNKSLAFYGIPSTSL